jgi:ferredoxin
MHPDTPVESQEANMNTKNERGRVIIPIAVSPDKSPIEPPADADAEMVSLYQAHKKIYPRSVTGFFSRWRWTMVWLTQLVFYGMPWLEWGQRQALLFDLGARRFYIFGLVLYPQDFIYLTGILVISAYSLFLFTAVAGRLWCGYACPQTVYTEIFLWLERKTEGDRSARMRRDAGPWTAEKLGRKVGKHLLWLAVALVTGFTFVGYFTPIHELAGEFVRWELSSWEMFWTFFYGFATYGMAGFMREQVCKYMCPYARFQSAMFDKDTLIVTYDAERGEPRGARSKKADPAKLNLGACVDCSLCVQVCPTGIDIRNGLQYECIGCGGLCRRLRYRHGQSGLPPRPGEVLHRKRHQPALDPSADPAPRTTPPGLDLRRHIGNSGDRHGCQPDAACAVQGGRGARPRRTGPYCRRWAH